VFRHLEVPWVDTPIGVALLQERIAPFDRLIGHVGKLGQLTGEQLLTDQAIVDQIEGSFKIRCACGDLPCIATALSKPTFSRSA
jgi:hypothetical protein